MTRNTLSVCLCVARFVQSLYPPALSSKQRWMSVGCTEIKECAVVMQLLKFCLKSLFAGSGLSLKKKMAATCNIFVLPLFKQQGSLCDKGRSPVDELHGVSSTATHRWGWFPSFRSADESEILGLVSTEWGRSVLCHHWYVVWRRCGGQRQTMWNNIPKHLRGTKCNLRYS